MDSPNNGKMGVFLTQMFQFWYHVGFMPALGLDDNGSMAIAFGRLLRALEDGSWPTADIEPKDMAEASWCIKNIMFDSIEKVEALLDIHQQQQQQKQDQQSASFSAPNSLRSLASTNTMAGRLIGITIAITEMLGQVKAAQDLQDEQDKQDQGTNSVYNGSSGRWNVFGRYPASSPPSSSSSPPPPRRVPLNRLNWTHPPPPPPPPPASRPWAPPPPPKMTPHTPPHLNNNKVNNGSIDESSLGDTVILREMNDNYFHGALSGTEMSPEYLFEIARHLAPEDAFSYTRPIPPENLQTLVCAVAGWALGSNAMKVSTVRLESLTYSQIVNMLVLSGTMLHRSTTDRSTAAASSSRSAFTDDSSEYRSTSTLRQSFSSSGASTSSRAGTVSPPKPRIFRVLAIAAANADDSSSAVSVNSGPRRDSPSGSDFSRPWNPLPPPLRPPFPLGGPIKPRMEPLGFYNSTISRHPPPPMLRPSGATSYSTPPRWPISTGRPLPYLGSKKKKKGTSGFLGTKSAVDSDDSRSNSGSDSDSGSDSNDSRGSRRSRRYQTDGDSDSGSDSGSESDSSDKKRHRRKFAKRHSKKSGSKSKSKTSKKTKKSKRGKKGDDDDADSDWDAVSEKSLTVYSASDSDSTSSASESGSVSGSDSDPDAGSDSDVSHPRRKSKKSKGKRKHRSSRKADASSSEASSDSGSDSGVNSAASPDSGTEDNSDEDYYSDDNPAATRDGFTRWFIDGLEKARKEAIKEAKAKSKKSSKSKGSKNTKSKTEDKGSRSAKVKHRDSFVVVD
ncbi:hypothetical protein SEUCBS139899_007048 [Sporothrix eucalyptigena]|uniref:Uncharacterized protein n=1 Tax=Sporothrix eucalyptigena TaxID=1812306 RepID=A0ABP0B7M6_9PEZI